MRHHVVPAIAVAALALGCGYQQGFSARKKHGIQTVAIAVVKNNTYRQGFDVMLTRRLGRDLNQYTGLVPGRPETADARLEVTLREVRGRPITETTGGAILEGGLLLAAEVRLVDRRSGAVLHEQKVSDWAEFRSPVGESLDSALSESVADLSRRILVTIDSPFGAQAATKR